MRKLVLVLLLMASSAITFAKDANYLAEQAFNHPYVMERASTWQNPSTFLERAGTFSAMNYQYWGSGYYPVSFNDAYSAQIIRIAVGRQFQLSVDDITVYFAFENGIYEAMDPNRPMNSIGVNWAMYPVIHFKFTWKGL